MRRKITLVTMSWLVALAAHTEVVDWDKIEHWCGDGPNRAALIVQLRGNDESPAPGALIWGCRWQNGETMTGEKLVRRVAENASDLVVLTQFTGDMGSTLDGIGFAEDVDKLLDNLQYDFEGASEDPKISFGFFEPNTTMSQTSAPGADTYSLVMEAIVAAHLTHVIEHPLNQKVYGYPAYDYDWWQLDQCSGNMLWNSGWYKGYWSYWCGGVDMDDLSYSGIGMSSVILEDGDVQGWKYIPIDEDNMNNDFGGYIDGYSSWLPLNYSHSFMTASVSDIAGDTDRDLKKAIYYHLDGTRADGLLSPGIYIKRMESSAKRIIVRNK